MTQPSHCPECGASWQDGLTCQDRFHQMLYWEGENPALAGGVHHLMVLCYYLQHPSLYSPEGLAGAVQLLVDFLEHGVEPDEARRKNRSRVDSSRRTWKIRGTPASRGTYQHPISWTMTAEHVTEGGIENYRASVQAWASSVLESLRGSNNLPGG